MYKYNILVVGAGGTGGLFTNFLAKFLNGRDKETYMVTLIDGDTVEAKNISRQPFVTEDVGESKAKALTLALTSAYDISMSYIGKYINSKNDIEQAFRAADSLLGYGSKIRILVGCVDNHAARKCMHDYFMDEKNCLYADSGNEFSHGEVVFGIKNKGKVIAPDKCFYSPDIFDGELTPRAEESCEALNNSAPQHLATNILAADILLSGIAGLISDRKMPNGIVHFDSGISGDFMMKHYPFIGGVDVREVG